MNRSSWHGLTEGLETAMTKSENGILRLRELVGYLSKMADVHEDAGKAMSKYGKTKLSKLTPMETASEMSEAMLQMVAMDEMLADEQAAYSGPATQRAVFRVLNAQTGFWAAFHADAAQVLSERAEDLSTLVKSQSRAVSELQRAVRKDVAELESREADAESTRKSYHERCEAAAEARRAVEAATGDPQVTADKYAALERKADKAQRRAEEAEASYDAALAGYNAFLDEVVGRRRMARLDELGAAATVRAAETKRTVDALIEAQYPQPCPHDRSRQQLGVLAEFLDGERDVRNMLVACGYEGMAPPPLAKDVFKDESSGGIVHASADFERKFEAYAGKPFAEEKAARRAARAARLRARGVFDSPVGREPAGESGPKPDVLLVSPRGGSRTRRRRPSVSIPQNRPLPSLPPQRGRTKQRSATVSIPEADDDGDDNRAAPDESSKSAPTSPRARRMPATRSNRKMSLGGAGLPPPKPKRKASVPNVARRASVSPSISPEGAVPARVGAPSPSLSPLPGLSPAASPAVSRTASPIPGGPAPAKPARTRGVSAGPPKPSRVTRPRADSERSSTVHNG
ncbi:uncharacterized protein AMSG_05356 [Thecamonas trahens ATCC 50062]|uniref:F-BAR domain-containing protein n=1 Tax=Thecamonas trahens ATCC 50062 TaxID=461836 RepID=A0A0L0DDF7_THETB|nr:hypothetical protein AMSG_05356 [Thecamonas trahens ATCC 50062]KNC49358.1 hypothetical protein AMSG_05356 [Thecamonas trahens ATCC 50062]|eukprot:XP_013757783.1 hypothetical protein AMSG_05356 [Thecamonas trahens ATCC 50062]